MENAEHNFSLVANWQIQCDFVKEMLEDSSFLEKLIILTQNLDKESIETIYRVLTRLKSAILQRQPITNLNAQEIDMLHRIQTEFYPNIFHIMPNLAYYDGYYLPVAQFSVSVFWYHLGLNQRGGGVFFI